MQNIHEMCKDGLDSCF